MNPVKKKKGLKTLLKNLGKSKSIEESESGHAIAEAGVQVKKDPRWTTNSNYKKLTGFNQARNPKSHHRDANPILKSILR